MTQATGTTGTTGSTASCEAAEWTRVRLHYRYCLVLALPVACKAVRYGVTLPGHIFHCTNETGSNMTITSYSSENYCPFRLAYTYDKNEHSYTTADHRFLKQILNPADTILLDWEHDILEIPRTCAFNRKQTSCITATIFIGRQAR